MNGTAYTTGIALLQWNATTQFTLFRVSTINYYAQRSAAWTAESEHVLPGSFLGGLRPHAS